MSDSALYSRLLFPKGQGYPLFHPQPSDDLPDPARRTGTEIGDVGLITQYGSFDPIFNILRARDDPSNRFGVPVAFEQVPLGSEDITAHVQFHLPGSDISNTTISKRRLDVEAGLENNIFLPLGAGAIVEVSTNSKQTGLLLLPDGASRWDLRRQQRFRDYALKHAHNWYAFVNGSLERMVGNGDLYLVTGVTKSTSWSVAAVENHSGEGKISLKLKAAQISNAGATCAWEWESGGSSVNSGPRRRAGEEEWRDNQTVFLRGFKVAVRTTPLRRAPKIRSIVQSKWSKMESKGTFIPFSQPQPSAAGMSIPSSQSQLPGHNENCLSQSPPSTTSSTGSTSSDDDESSSTCYHPSALINEHLLDCVVGATVAVTHDDEWASVLTKRDNEVPGHHELIRRISSKFQMSIVCGGVCLHEPLSPLASQETSQYTLSIPMSGTNGSVANQMFQPVSYNDIATETTGSALSDVLMSEDTTPLSLQGQADSMPTEFFKGSSDFAINGGNFQEFSGRSHFINHIVVSPTTREYRQRPAGRGRQMDRNAEFKDEGSKKGKASEPPSNVNTETVARREQTKAVPTKPLDPLPRSSATEDLDGKIRRKPVRIADNSQSNQRSTAPGCESAGNSGSMGQSTTQQTEKAGKKRTQKGLQTPQR